MKIALVYDRINKIGGAERVLESLHQLWPKAPFFTSVYNPKTAPFANNWQVCPSFLQFLPLAKSHHEFFPMLMPFAFESFNFNQFDVVISITSAEAKGIITQPKTLHVCYCLTPTRYLYSHKNLYANLGSNILKKPKQVLLNKLRVWDQVAANRPDHYIAISKTTQSRIKKYYHQNSQIIYPPVNTNFFRPSNRRQSYDRKYFLIVSRLVHYKNIKLAINACNQLEIPLKIIGTGKYYKSLKKLAGSNIQFLGNVSNSKLLQTYQNCKALIFPGNEDFGLTMVEALSCSRPVIAYNLGGAREIISHKQNGLLFDKLTVLSLIKQIKALDLITFNKQKLRDSAVKYNQQKFLNLFKDTINKLWIKHQQHQ